MIVNLTRDMLEEGIPPGEDAARARSVAEINGYTAFGLVAPGVGVWIAPMIFNHRVVTGPLDGSGVDDGWCYDDFAQAYAALRAWDPATESEPSGWKRHPRTGRRRPNGDATLEYVEH